MSITRVDYRERQRLTAADLRAEQDYRVALARRHHLGPHDWGVVRGLHVTGARGGPFVVEPGVAIDGYGREIVVPRPEPVQPPVGLAEWTVVLYYCDRPAQVPPDRRCEDVPAPRTSQRYVIVAVRDPVVEPGSPGRPWPIRLATVKGLGATIDLSLTRYVRHRASMVAGPARRVSLQLGLRDHTDVYHALLTAPGSAPQPRIGIDRDGEFHVWRPLQISGSDLVGTFASASGVSIAVQLPAPSGIGVSRNMTVMLDPRQVLLRRDRTVDVAITDTRPGVLPLVSEATLTEVARSAGGVSPGVRDFAGRLAMLEIAGPVRTLFPVRRAQQALTKVEVPLAKAHGGIWLQEPEAPSAEPVVARCGEEPRSRTQASLGRPVMQFQPGTAFADEPTSRAIQAVTVSAPTDVIPRTALQVRGGAFDASDGGSRVAVGRFDGTDWQPVIEMTGAGGVRLIKKTNASVLHVPDDTVFLPSIGANDPLLPELVALAFISGLPRHPTKRVKISGPTGPVTRGVAFTYKVKLDTPGATIKRSFEVIIGAAEPRDLSVRPIASLTTTDATVTAVTRHRSNAIDLFVVCLVEHGTRNRLDLAKLQLTVTP
jgi:hypothetical protein